jgi:hypothetical protein
MPALRIPEIVPPALRLVYVEGHGRTSRTSTTKVSYPCWVADLKGQLRNISEQGAILEIDNAPDQFILFLTMDGDRKRPCRVIWREGLQVGVIFDHSIKDSNGGGAQVE